ncbi:AsmA family protein [Sphingobium sp. SYK-6]|uniref:AsmA family protein n=1 Tax=Sphingobium sp. (strain NBRC 103272 / SYK-6) TaxID=627192 RepID=UPI0002277778|nr:AsmA-like C-terminal region-containing protein [Sphingobium sp. SYK-6]BAK66243.1 AsmA family protein [Sphingobium sp. SYK-6]
MDFNAFTARFVSSGREGWRRMTRSRRVRWIAIASASLLLLLVLLLGAFPVGMAKGWLERKLSSELNAPVSIESLGREPFFSFSPTLVVRGLRIAQPDWAGPGELLRAQDVRVRVALIPALTGSGRAIRGIHARGALLALVRDENRRSNWSGERDDARTGSGGASSIDLADLVITDSRFTLRDARRGLEIAGTIAANATTGLAARATGRFHGEPIEASVKGAAIAGRPAGAAYPFQLALSSPLLQLDARGTMKGALNTSDMAMTMSARAPTLKYLDDIIEAGLFGTQPIDLRASVRRQGQDWFLDRLSGSVGRSRLTGRAEILKREGRSKIDATIAFSQFDFDDLADDAGLAAQAALEARIGPRVLPNTRINLAKVGPTDGTIRFTAARLLFKSPSVFRSLRGKISLQGKVLRLDDVEAGLSSGRLTGRLLVDHREGESPRLDLDLRLRSGRLGALLDMTEQIDAPVNARIALSGRGDTIRAALSKSTGHVGLAAGEGRISRTIAAVLAQDMGKAIGAALGDGDAPVPLRCIAIGFRARGGMLTAAPFLVETEVSRSRGEGTINLDGERIALRIGGASRESSGLPMVDPLGLEGTLSAPSLDLAAGRKGDGGGVAGAVVRSIGGALGLVDKRGPAVDASGPSNCRALSERVLARGLPERP